MKLANHDLDFGMFFYNQSARDEFERIKPILKRKYALEYKRAGITIPSWQLDEVFYLIKGDLKGKRILDLGCGSVDSPDGRNSDGVRYKPWLCRTLHELGAKAIGFDLGDLSKEEFEGHTTRGLRSSDSLNEVQSNSIDVACAFSLFDSPSHYDGNQLLRILLPQLNRVIKPEGVFLFEACGTGFCNEEKYAAFLKETGLTDIGKVERVRRQR